MFGISPAVLYGTDHSGKMAFPVDFPYSHHGASTSFVGLHEPLPPVVFLVAAIATTYPRAAASQTFHGNGCHFTFRQFVGSVRKFAPCRSLLGVGSRSPEKTRDLTPTAVPFPYKIYSRDLHLFMYSVALCGRRHPVQEARFKSMLTASNTVVSGHRSYWKQHRGAPYTITWSPPHISSVRLARNMQSVPASTTITRTEFIGKDGSAASLRRYVGGS